NQWSERISPADFAKHFADRGDKVAHVILVDAADSSDPKAVTLAQLAGIDNEAARTETTIEIFESEIRNIWITKRSNDVALTLRARPLVASSAVLRASTQEKPGTPSRHLLGEEIK